MFHRLGRDLEQAREHAVLTGSVRTEHPSDLPILVLVYTGDVGREQLVDYFVMAGPGRYYFVVPAGTFTDTVRTREWSPLEPEVEEFKAYASGVGLLADAELLRQP